MFVTRASDAGAAESVSPARSHPLDRAIALVLSSMVGLTLWALLRRGLFAAQAQSHDAALYVRSLWGIAHGDFDNSLVGHASLAIHSQLVLLVLAPLARVFHAADVLIAAQALTFAATLFLWLCALLRVGRAHSAFTNLSAPPLAAWASVLFTFGMPLVANPFVFDVRPEILGVFFATAGLVRAAERQRFDRCALALLIVSAAAREEFALTAACALTLAPVARNSTGVSLRARVIVASVLVAYALFNSYLYFSPRSASQAAHLESAATWQDLVLSKLQLSAAFAAAAGGLAAIGYRWLGSALPGLGMLALSTWMARDQISFHYGMFVAPALLTASYAGYAAVVASRRRPACAWLGTHVALTLACAAFLSALPGGARFASQHFDVQGPLLSPATWRAHTRWLVDVHHILQSVPPDHSLWLQYMLATPYATRASIRVLEVENPEPWQPDEVFLPKQLWATRGRQLREQGYQLTSLAGGASFALLSRRTHTPLASILSADGCENASVRWQDASLGLCNAWLEADGRVMVLLGRNAAHTLSGMRLELSAGEKTMTLAPLDGLISLDELPPGRVAWGRSPEAVPSAKVTFTLRQNGAIVPLSVQGQQRDRVTLTLLPP